MSVDRSYVATNDAERERLRAFVARLSDDDMARHIGYGWTVSVALAHLAYWDRRTTGMMEKWEREGVATYQPVDPDPINDGLAPEWLATPFDEVRREVIAAAEASDRKAAALSPKLVEEILAIRPRTLIRGLHRRQHLDEAERAL